MTNKEAIEALKLMAAQVEWEYPLEWQEAIDKAVEALKRAQGRWINKRKEAGAVGMTYIVKQCSCCGFTHSLVIPVGFCPNCGADMRGGQDE